MGNEYDILIWWSLLISVQRIALGLPCGPGSVCADVYATCRAGRCQCKGDFEIINNKCCKYTWIYWMFESDLTIWVKSVKSLHAYIPTSMKCSAELYPVLFALVRGILFVWSITSALLIMMNRQIILIGPVLYLWLRKASANERRRYVTSSLIGWGLAQP